MKKSSNSAQVQLTQGLACSDFEASRAVSSVVSSRFVREGAGFAVARPFPLAGLEQLDPFLLLDHMLPEKLLPGQAKGAPDHPHRGFETVTYLLAGEMEHRDSAGNSGFLRPGDVQWMTAGSGVIHSEMPSQALLRDGGVLHGFQLWVNLPASKKMMAPRYQDLKSESIKEIESEDGLKRVRLIAGKFENHQSACVTEIPIVYLHVRLLKNGVFEYQPEPQQTVLAYFFGGQTILRVSQKNLESALSGPAGASVELKAPSVLVSAAEPVVQVRAEELAVFEQSDLPVRIVNESDATLEFIFLVGKPIGEPVARYGPFVMNTRKEIEQAVLDFQSGNFVSASSGRALG
jgi:redox-sensitive bicupin YhaK (pirin superfamily)